MNIRLSGIICDQFSEVHKAIKNNEYLEYFLKGGRGSTKSSFVAIEIILGIMKDANNGIHSNCVAMRKVGLYLKDSVHEQLIWAIDMLGVTQYWDSKTSPQSLTYISTGQKILFRGADKPKKIKSIKFSKGYCKYIWYEELDEFEGMHEIRTINQSLMRGGDEFAIFYTYNPPQSVVNWVNGEAVKTKPNRLIHHSDYTKVPRQWLGENFIQEAEHLKKTKPELYNHEYLGIVTGTGGEVFKNVKLREITNEEIKTFTNLNRGLDFGYATDPVAYNATYYDRKHKRLFVCYEIDKVEMSNSMLYQAVKQENPNNELVIADSAEPRTINELTQLGMRVIGAKKGHDSVEYGVKWLQDLEEIIIDDMRCPNTAREFTTYELEKDTKGNFKAKFPDRNNHHIDAIRYALNFEIMKHREEKKEAKKLEPIERYIDEITRW